VTPTTDAKPRSAMEAAVLPALDAVTNRDLLRWMFRFLAPVKPLVVSACAWLVLWVGAEVLSVRQAGNVVNQIQKLHQSNSPAAAKGLWHWMGSGETDPHQLVLEVKYLAALVALMSIVRY
jgi:hypothetical protein